METMPRTIKGKRRGNISMFISLAKLCLFVRLYLFPDFRTILLNCTWQLPWYKTKATYVRRNLCNVDAAM